MMNDSTLKAVRKLKNGEGDYIWQMGNVQNGVPGTLNGRRYYVNQAMASIATGNKALAFGDLSKYFVRKVGAPVIFTNVEYQPGGADGGVFFRKVPALKVFEKGSPLGAFPVVLSPEDGDFVITKRYASAFFATHLAATLTSLGVDTLLIAGVSTSGCVRATALDTCQSGFLPFVVRDACGDRHPGPHEANLFDLQAKYAEVISEEVALAHLQALSAR